MSTNPCSTPFTMQRFNVGDSVQLAIPDASQSLTEYEDMDGEVIEVIKDDLGKITGDPRDSYFYRIKLANDKEFCARDSDINKID